MKSELKITSYSPKQIARITGGELCLLGKGAGLVRQICTDSREATEGSLFVAIPGERVDGHDYMSAASEKGAVCYLASRVPDAMREKDGAVILVEDPVKALCALAADYRGRSTAKVVAVTGSVGKTTTKEFIAAVAAAGFTAHKTEGNHNNDLGLAMTLFTLSPEDVLI